jgi:2-(1,2-epoxy-1,2-dihydrophenyl)acetyl-CoA isomerase
MGYEQILTETHGRVGIVVLNRPERRNALSARMSHEMTEALEAYNADPGIGAVVLTGADPAFCGGADVGDWKQDIDEGTRESERLTRGTNWVEFFSTSKPVVCAVNGPSIGAGLTLTLSCDARIASDRARFSMRFIRMGIVPELASTKLLPLIVGFNRALELMLTGKTIDGAEAERIGLVNRMVPHEKLMDEALALASAMAANPTELLAVVKRLTWQHLAESDLRKIMVAEGTELLAAVERPAFREAVNAFMEKRQPDFHKGG